MSSTAPLIEKLNNDCLLLIFKMYGPREWLVLAEVCRKWRDLIKNDLWPSCHTFQVYNSCRDLNQAIIRECIKRDELIMNDKLIIEYTNINISEVIRILTQILPNLTKICLFNYYYDKKEYTFMFGRHCYYNSKGGLRFPKILDILKRCKTINFMKLLNIRLEEEFQWIEIINKNVDNLKCLYCYNVDNPLFKKDIKYMKFINNFFAALPKTLETLELHFKNRTYNFEQLLNKQLTLKHLLYPYIDMSHQHKTLLKHAKTIKTLKLELFRSYCVYPEFWNISKFTNLEKIVFTGDFSNAYNFENFIDSLKECKHLTQVKLDSIHITDEKLTEIMCLPNLKVLKLNLISLVHQQITPSLELEKLTTLHINSVMSNQNTFFSSLCEAFKKMPVLSALSISEYEHIFCENYIFSIIDTITTQRKYVLIEPLKYIYNYCNKKMEIYRVEKFSSRSENLCFKLSMEIKCCYNFNDSLLQDASKLSHHEVLKNSFERSN